MSSGDYLRLVYCYSLNSQCSTHPYTCFPISGTHLDDFSTKGRPKNLRDRLQSSAGDCAGLLLGLCRACLRTPIQQAKVNLP